MVGVRGLRVGRVKAGVRGPQLGQETVFVR